MIRTEAYLWPGQNEAKTQVEKKVVWNELQSIERKQLLRCRFLDLRRPSVPSYTGSALMKSELLTLALQSDVTWHEDNWGNWESKFLAFT